MGITYDFRLTADQTQVVRLAIQELIERETKNLPAAETRGEASQAIDRKRLAEEVEAILVKQLVQPAFLRGLQSGGA